MDVKCDLDMPYIKPKHSQRGKMLGKITLQMVRNIRWQRISGLWGKTCMIRILAKFHQVDRWRIMSMGLTNAILPT